MNDDDMMVQGFRFSAVSAGLRKKAGLDLALILSDQDTTTAAGMFTTNRVKAAPVRLDQERIRTGAARAIIANAGNANACSGREGLDAARRSSELLAATIGVKPEEILVASTGVIGQVLPVARIENALPELVEGLDPRGAPKAAEAIMTTDSFPKLSRFTGEVGGKPFTILGMAKGAGMIMPDMATMLCFIVTDLRIETLALRSALRVAVQKTFNRITVDGDTSTNDTVLVLANGLAGNGSLGESGELAFRAGLTEVLGELSEMIVRDGEGASKLVHIHLKGAVDEGQAILAAKTVANSPLVKTAFYGQDPNWGRIMAALGRSGVIMQEERVDIWIDDVQIVAAGLGLGVEAEARAAEKMHEAAFDITVDLHMGRAEERVSTCDFTHKYVSINADYRT